MIQFLLLFLTLGVLHGKVDRLMTEGYLGERKLDGYAGRHQPLIFLDVYQGKLTFDDERFFQNYFQHYGFPQESDLSFFLRSELSAGLTCSNELFSEHFDVLRYSYRLVTLSYLLEGQWHVKLLTDHFRLKDSCDFDLQKWAGSCRPKSPELKQFVERLKKYARFDETLPPAYKKDDWWKEFSTGKGQTYSHYKMMSSCKGKCIPEDMGPRFKLVCAENRRLMDLICNEEDELYGLSANRDAYSLLGQSNIINTFNKKGEAMGCLRRFSEVMAHREVQYPPLAHLFPVIQNELRQKYRERWLQGRVFFFGASKEFEEKGLQEVFVAKQDFKVEPIRDEPEPAVEKKAQVQKVPEKKPEPVTVVEVKPKKKEIVEIKNPPKSAFLQAAEIRLSGNLPQVEVDMLKLKYDYVFTLNMMNTLSERLKTFMTREALAEMMTYDKLGTVEGPVPLLFIKFMVDMQEHQGLWNMISVLGERFYVSNEIDSAFAPKPELIQLVNNETTGRQWQIFILRP